MYVLGYMVIALCIGAMLGYQLGRERHGDMPSRDRRITRNNPWNEADWVAYSRAVKKGEK